MEGHLRGKLGEHQSPVNLVPLQRRLSTYLADSLRRLVGLQAPRFGHLGLPSYFPLGGKTWVEAEQVHTGEKMEKEDA